MKASAAQPLQRHKGTVRYKPRRDMDVTHCSVRSLCFTLAGNTWCPGLSSVEAKLDMHGAATEVSAGDFECVCCPFPPVGHRALSHDCRPRSAIPARSTKPLIATSANGHEVAFVPIAALVPHDINVTGCQSKIEILRCAANAVASLQCAVPHLACA